MKLPPRSPGANIWRGIAHAERRGGFACTTLYEPPDNTAFKDRALYIVNTDQGSVVEVTIDAHGDPGTPSVFATGIFSPDGITLGPWRDLYVSDAFTGRVIRIASDGTTEVAASSGFAEPANTSLVFGAALSKTRSTSRTSASPPRGVVKVNLCDR